MAVWCRIHTVFQLVTAAVLPAHELALSDQRESVDGLAQLTWCGWVSGC